MVRAIKHGDSNRRPFATFPKSTVRWRGAAWATLAAWTWGRVRVDERALRHYTPASFDTQTGELDVVFYLHGRGPDSAWATRLAVAQDVLVLGPGNGGLSLTPDCNWHLFLGDETTVGVCHALTRAVPADVPVLGAIEIEAGEEASVALFVPSLHILTRQSNRGAALDAWLDEVTLPSGNSQVYLLGHNPKYSAAANNAIGARGQS